MRTQELALILNENFPHLNIDPRGCLKIFFEVVEELRIKDSDSKEVAIQKIKNYKHGLVERGLL